MRILCLVSLCILITVPLSSTALAQSDCFSKIFDPQGGIKCNDKSSGGASSTFGGLKNDKSEDNTSNNQQSSGNSGYFNSGSYFNVKDYYNNRTNPTGNTTQQQSGGTENKQSFGSK